MKTILIEKENEGLMALMGKRVLILSAVYFYEGKLIGINDTCVKLTDTHIVYSTGPWSDSEYSDKQKLHVEDWYVQLGLIESFGLSKND